MTTVTTTTVVVTTTGLGSLALVVTIALIGMLVIRDVVKGRESLSARRISRALLIGILPLLTVFAVDVVIRAMEVLS
jgi:hypothetical protein